MFLSHMSVILDKEIKREKEQSEQRQLAVEADLRANPRDPYSLGSRM